MNVSLVQKWMSDRFVLIIAAIWLAYSGRYIEKLDCFFSTKRNVFTGGEMNVGACEIKHESFQFFMHLLFDTDTS